ncbi:MAG: SGNH/GDSL hydrolase family protein [Propylenella sp.]
MKTVLCYGDSNTWGAAVGPRANTRYAADERWPGVLRAALGGGWTVIEEGLPGRTTVHPDPIEGHWLDGSAYLLPCLRSHRPLDLVVLALGTNDLKMRFSVSPGDIANGIGMLLTIIAKSEAGPNDGAPKALVVCPAPILSHHGECPEFTDMFAGGHEKSLRLAPAVAAVAKENGAAFLNAGDVIQTSSFDGIHLEPDAQAKLGRAVAETILRLGL